MYHTGPQPGTQISHHTLLHTVCFKLALKQGFSALVTV
eukprot:COSAG05_NODE_2338_length_3213_cov_1.894990_6_plen_37_part_01